MVEQQAAVAAPSLDAEPDQPVVALAAGATAAIPEDVAAPAPHDHDSGTGRGSRLRNPLRGGRARDEEVDAELTNLQRERDRIRQLIDALYSALPNMLKHDDEAMESNLTHLATADSALAETPLTRENIIKAQQSVTRVQGNLSRIVAQRHSFNTIVIVLVVVLLTGVALGFLFYRSTSLFGMSFEELQFIGVPAPVWVWALVGTLTSMLLRAGQLPFNDRVEANRWLVYRPMVGIVMGVMTYLLLQAGLIVFTNEGQTQTPELVWVVAFVGGFSDTLSVRLLKRALGAPEDSVPEHAQPRATAT